MTTGLYMLRAVQLGVKISEMKLLTVGMIYDMFIENNNDYFLSDDRKDKTYRATQADMDRF